MLHSPSAEPTPQVAPVPELGPIARLPRRFAGDRRGVVAVIFAGCLVLLVALVGGMVDFLVLHNLRDAAQRAADAAALSVLSKGLEDEPGKAFVRTMFEENVPPASREGVSMGAVTIERSETDNAKRVRVHFDVAWTPRFLSVIGIRRLNASGLSEAMVSLKRFVDLYLLVDTSESMGLAADNANRDALRALTKAEKNVTVSFSGPSCEFACHRKGDAKDSKTVLDIARANDIQLRIDVARAGIGAVADLAKTMAAQETFVRMQIDAFSSTLVPVLARTKDLAAVRAKAGSLEIGLGAAPHANGCWSGYANTWFERIAPGYAGSVSSAISTARSAETDNRQPKSYVLIVTDGLHSQNCAANGPKGEENVYPFRKEYCDAIRQTGARVAVIYTEYLKSDSSTYKKHAQHAVEPDLQYQYEIGSNKSPGIEDNLRRCADPGLFAKGNDPDEIDKAFRTIFDNIKVQNHLTK